MVDSALADKQFLKRIQDDFEPEDLTRDKLNQWITMGEKGRHQVSKGKGEGKKWVEGSMSDTTRRNISELVDRLQTEDVFLDIKNIKEIDLKENRKLKVTISDLPVHSSKVSDKFNEKINELTQKRVVEVEKEFKALQKPMKELPDVEYKRYRDLSRGGITVPEYEDFPQEMKTILDQEARKVSWEVVGKSISYKDIAENRSIYADLEPADKTRITNALKSIR